MKEIFIGNVCLLLNELSKLFAELFKKNIDKIRTFYTQSQILNLNHTFYNQPTVNLSLGLLRIFLCLKLIFVIGLYVG